MNNNNIRDLYIYIYIYIYTYYDDEYYYGFHIRET